LRHSRDIKERIGLHVLPNFEKFHHLCRHPIFYMSTTFLLTWEFPPLESQKQASILTYILIIVAIRLLVNSILYLVKHNQSFATMAPCTILEYLSRPNPDLSYKIGGGSGTLTVNDKWVPIEGIRPWSEFTFHNLYAKYKTSLGKSINPYDPV
jgi:hypothetical protein